MKTFWMSTLSAVLLAVSAGVTNAADKKASKKSQSAARTVQPGSLPSVSDAAVGIERALMFDGAVLTQARAEQIAVAANFTLIDFHRCSTGENCAIFEVRRTQRPDLSIPGARGALQADLVAGNNCPRHSR